MELIKDIFYFMADKGIRGVTIVLLLVSSIAIFISPSFIFIYLYKRILFSEDTLYTTVMILAIIDSIIFIGLLFASLIVLPFIHSIKDNKQLISNDNSVKMFYGSVSITIALMGVISTVQLICYCIKYIFNPKCELSYGISVVLITLSVIIGILVFMWIKVACKKKKCTNEYEKILNEYENRANRN